MGKDNEAIAQSLLDRAKQNEIRVAELSDKVNHAQPLEAAHHRTNHLSPMMLVARLLLGLAVGLSVLMIWPT